MKKATDVCVALFPGPLNHPVFDHLQYAHCKQSKIGWWEVVEMRLTDACVFYW